MDNDLLSLTADIVTAHVSNNTVSPADLPDLIASTYAALAATSAPTAVEEIKPEPAVSVRASIKHDYLVCLEDGKKLKMMKRYLRTNYNMSPEEYRAKWGLPRDYPMVAPAYAEQRRGLAKQIGLGRRKAEPQAGGITVRDGKSSADGIIGAGDGKAPTKPRIRSKNISAAKKAAKDHLSGGSDGGGG